jgi:hypothetical protein
MGTLDEKGRRHGQGVMLFKDGTYEGGWKNGKQHGKGKYEWHSGSKYEGDWADGKFDGFGTYTWPSGATYTGEWKKGKKNGHGRFVWANGTTYEGQFVDDKKHGIGEYISGTDGTKYYGEYENDKMHGQGTYLFPDGARFVGEFRNNNFEGFGTYTTPDGTCYVGEFKNDQRHGVGLLKPPHLGVFKVRYVAGKIVEHQDIFAWLKEIQCAKYTELFKKEEITFEELPGMTDEDLQKLGVTEFGKRRKLLAAIAELPNTKKKTIEKPNPEFEDDLDLGQGDDPYNDIPDGLVLEAGENGSTSSFGKSNEIAVASGEQRQTSIIANFDELSYRVINWKEIKIEKRPIGRGVFGIVYRGEWRGATVAVKKLIGNLGEKEMNELYREATLLEKLCHHPHVVNYIGLVKSPDVCLVTQFYPKGSLYEIVVRRRQELPWKAVVGMARDAAAGVLHLHAEHVIHRDIAARNCLVDSNNRVVVTDFGLSRVKTSAYLMSNNNFGPVAWMAPEALLERKFSEKSDAYSFGVMLWELVARKSQVYPDESPYNIAVQVIEGRRPVIPDSCPQEFRELMNDCWQKDPEARPDFADIEKRLAAYFWSLPDV